MDRESKIAEFYNRDRPFKQGISILRELALATGLQETYKWGAPVYTWQDKNVLGIMAFKNHFGIWFFNGSFLTDPIGVLQNSQEGTTKAMRHWKFSTHLELDREKVLAYMTEAKDNQEMGMVHRPEKRSMEIPKEFSELFGKDRELKSQFFSLAPYKQREYYAYLASAKREATKLARMEKCILLIQKGMGLNDHYRN
ncbi:MAG: DUF1801 domain-containing protein [Sediminicola sp.]